MVTSDHGPGGPSHLAWNLVTKNIFRGNPRLLISALPWALAIVLIKYLADVADLQIFEVNPLLAGAIGAEVFIVGFLLNGTAGDFKEAEKLPGEVAASLESIADECLITYNELKLPEARTALAQLLEIGRSVRMWLLHDRGLDDVMSDIRALNGPYAVMAPAIQAGFTTRLKTEQAAIRKLVIRMDTMRRTSYVSAGYLIAEVTAVILMVVLVITDFETKMAASLALVGLISYLLVYLVSLIRDLDNPFEYANGAPGAADVSLDVLERNEDRLRALLGSLSEVPVIPSGASAGENNGEVAAASVAADDSREPPA